MHNSKKKKTNQAFNYYLWYFRTLIIVLKSLVDIRSIYLHIMEQSGLIRFEPMVTLLLIAYMYMLSHYNSTLLRVNREP
jgi:hypothetical protein